MFLSIRHPDSETNFSITSSGSEISRQSNSRTKQLEAIYAFMIHSIMDTYILELYKYILAVIIHYFLAHIMRLATIVTVRHNKCFFNRFLENVFSRVHDLTIQKRLTRFIVLDMNFLPQGGPQVQLDICQLLLRCTCHYCSFEHSVSYGCSQALLLDRTIAYVSLAVFIAPLILRELASPQGEAFQFSSSSMPSCI